MLREKQQIEISLGGDYYYIYIYEYIYIYMHIYTLSSSEKLPGSFSSFPLERVESKWIQIFSIFNQFSKIRGKVTKR